jgi:nicotinamide-nucleotide amidase
MPAAILSIGDELTIGQTLNTNSAWVAERLAACAVLTIEHRTVADDREAITRAVRELVARCDVLVITGGLGPTLDDLTRQALGDVLTPDEPLVCDEAAAEHVRARFARRGRPMPESNLIQAMRPHTMRFLPNPNGTAMGLAGVHGRCALFALPGPPNEMQPMFCDHVAPALPAGVGGSVIRTAAVHMLGLGESDAAERLGDLMRRDRNPMVGTTVSQSIVSARVRTEGDAAWTERELAATIAAIEQRWHPYVYGRDDVSLAAAAGALLRERSLLVTTAESCTGGLLGSMIVQVAGSSDHYVGGWVTYSNQMKIDQLGVPSATLARHGAVSPQVADAMARGALARSAGDRGGAADVALAVTGIAGPGGGSASKPVGLVCIALASRRDGEPLVRTRDFHFSGSRGEIRDRAAKCALQVLRFHLLEVDAATPLLWECAARTDSRSEVVRA